MSRRPSISLARFAGALFATSLKSALALRATFLLQVAFMACNNLIVFVFWLALFAKVPAIRGWQCGDICLLYGVSAAGFGLAMIFAGGAYLLGRTIDDGELDALLVQPKPTLLYAVGSRSHASGLGDLASGIALIALSGELPLVRVPYAALAVTASGLVFASTWIVYQSLTFWLGRSETLGRLLMEATITFSLYPEPLFGGGLRLLLFSLIPAGFVAYVPTRVLRAPSAGGVYVLLVSAACYALLAGWVFRRGLRRYASGSRFGVFG